MQIIIEVFRKIRKYPVINIKIINYLLKTSQCKLWKRLQSVTEQCNMLSELSIINRLAFEL